MTLIVIIPGVPGVPNVKGIEAFVKLHGKLITKLELAVTDCT